MNRNKVTQAWAVVSTLLLIAIIVAACSSQSQALDQARQNAANRVYYVPVNDVEGRNYDWRLRMSDDPAQIVWCTMFPPTPGVKPFTVPITGKLTSGGKRPFPIESGSGYENPDAQGMYGSSGEYRYGFGPTGMQEYYDSYQMPTFCTTQPLVWQAELTVIVQEKNGILQDASVRAHDALTNGDTAGAAQILNDAIKQLQGGQ